MSQVNQSYKKHKRQPNMCRKSRMSLEQGERIGPYEIKDLLKEGSSSKIYLAFSKYTNEPVAIKTIKKSHFKDHLDELLLLTKQIETLKILKHRNIITLYEIYESKKYIYLVTEYSSGKDLIEKIIQKKRFNEEEALRIFFQLLDAFTYMHKMNICHLNIRTEHILFDKNNRPKIVGFGYSSFYEKEKMIEGAYGSLCYACPEIIDEAPYNPELADVWSLGVILYVLICGYLPFSEEDDNKNKILISSGKVDYPKEISNKLKDLLRHMLDINPKKRYTFQKIIKHPWIKPYSEKIFSGGINIYKTIYPVDDRILNIINQYGFDKSKVKNDMIMNKYNIGTGLYKQIVRKLLDLKIKNISDLWSEEFMAYRDDKKNQCEDGDKKYEDYINKIDEKYKKKEDFVNDFKEREEYVAERLVNLQGKKEDEKKEKLNIIEEAIADYADEDENEKTNRSDNEGESNQKDEQINVRKVKTERNKLFPRTKTPMFNFGGSMKKRKNNGSSNINNENNENIEIVYNKAQDVDIIQQFQDEQNKKLSKNMIPEKQTIKRSPSTPNFGKDLENKVNNTEKTNPFNLSITPEKKAHLAKKILDQKKDSNLKDIIYSTKKKDKIQDSIYSSKNSLYSNLHNLYSGKINHYKSIISGATLKTLTSEGSNKSLFRMTCFGNSSNKSCLDRGSLYDDFLKKNHPDNIRKTILNKNNTLNSNMNKIDEGNDDTESEKENNEKKEDENKKEINNLKESLKLKYSLSFGDDDENEEDEENSLERKETDLKLFDILENENDEELQELKKIYFGDKANKDLKKSINNKKSVKFNDDNGKEEEIKSPDPNLKKSTISKKTNTSILSNSVFDKYEEKLKEYNKTHKINDDKEINVPSRFDTQLEISFHDEDKINYVDKNTKFYHNDEPSKKLDFLNKEELGFSIDNIYNKIKKDFILEVKENSPIKKINISDDPKRINNNISKIHELFLKKNKRRPKKPINSQSSKYKRLNEYSNGVRKVDEAIQIDVNKIPYSKKLKRIQRQEYFSIFPNVNRDLNSIYFNGNTYNGNSSIDMSKYNNNSINRNTYYPNTVKYDSLMGRINSSNISAMKERRRIHPQNSNLYNNENYEYNTPYYNRSLENTYNPNEDNNRVNKVIKQYYYKIENNTISKNSLKRKEPKHYKPISPKNNNIEEDIRNKKQNKILEKYKTNSQMKKFNSYYRKYDDINSFSNEEPLLSKTTRKIGYISVKNIKDEVVVKRNEIMDKIKHCQNLLSTIMKERDNFETQKRRNNNLSINMENEPNISSFNRRNNSNYNFEYQKPKSRIIDMKKAPNRIKDFEINDNINKTEINQIYFKKIDGNKVNKYINRNKINKYMNNNNINKDIDTDKNKNKSFKTIMLPRYYTNKSKIGPLMRSCLNPDNDNNTYNNDYNNTYNNNDYNNTNNNRQYSNYSLDYQEAQLPRKDEIKYIYPRQKLVGIYKKNENSILTRNIEKNPISSNYSFNNRLNSNNIHRNYKNTNSSNAFK